MNPDDFIRDVARLVSRRDQDGRWDAAMMLARAFPDVGDVERLLEATGFEAWRFDLDLRGPSDLLWYGVLRYAFSRGHDDTFVQRLATCPPGTILLAPPSVDREHLRSLLQRPPRVWGPEDMQRAAEVLADLMPATDEVMRMLLDLGLDPVQHLATVGSAFVSWAVALTRMDESFDVAAAIAWARARHPSSRRLDHLAGSDRSVLSLISILKRAVRVLERGLRNDRPTHAWIHHPREPPGDDARTSAHRTQAAIARRDLRTTFARLLPEEADARAALHDLGVSAAHVDFTGGAVARWFRVIQEFERLGRLEDLRQYVVARRPGSVDFDATGQDARPLEGSAPGVPALPTAEPSWSVLDGSSRRDVEEAILQAFPTWDALSDIAVKTFGVPLSDFTDRGPLRGVVFALIQHALARGTFGSLLCAALDACPDDERLFHTARELVRVSGAPVSERLAALLQR